MGDGRSSGHHQRGRELSGDVERPTALPQTEQVRLSSGICSQRSANPGLRVAGRSLRVVEVELVGAAGKPFIHTE